MVVKVVNVDKVGQLGKVDTTAPNRISPKWGRIGGNCTTVQVGIGAQSGADGTTPTFGGPLETIPLGQSDSMCRVVRSVHLIHSIQPQQSERRDAVQSVHSIQLIHSIQVLANRVGS